MHGVKEFLGVVTAVIVLISAILGLATQVGAFGDARIGFLPDLNPQDGSGEGDPPEVPDPLGSCDPRVKPSLSLSVGSGPSGTELTVSGQDFCPDEQVVIDFHTEQIQVAQTDADGVFSVDARIPGTFDFTAPSQIDIRVRGQGGRFATTPFQLTAP